MHIAYSMMSFICKFFSLISVLALVWMATEQVRKDRLHRLQTDLPSSYYLVLRSTIQIGNSGIPDEVLWRGSYWWRWKFRKYGWTSRGEFVWKLGWKSAQIKLGMYINDNCLELEDETHIEKIWYLEQNFVKDPVQGSETSWNLLSDLYVGLYVRMSKSLCGSCTPYSSSTLESCYSIPLFTSYSLLY